LVVELPDPVAPPEAPLPGVLGVVVLLPEPVAPELELLPLAPEPDLLKWASHSEREICPSLLVSTDEKVGADMLELAPLDDIPDEPLELEPDAEGDDLSLLLEDELCAIATPDRARSAAAAALVTSFTID
jgi:hypothetical protein